MGQIGCIMSCFNQELIVHDESHESILQDSENYITSKKQVISSYVFQEIKNKKKLAYAALIFYQYTQDSFNVIQVLGEGSYAKVMLAQHKLTCFIYFFHQSFTEKLYAMKILNKSNIVKESQKRHVTEERIILEIVENEFIVKQMRYKTTKYRLRYAFQSKKHLYLVVDYIEGGELFYHMRKMKQFNESITAFYAAEILLAIEYLHERDIIYRDLKPENILIDIKGHIKLTDFGLSKILIKGNNLKKKKKTEEKAFSMCGTPEYLAPEILLDTNGYEKVCDFWSLGCLIYEMLIGYPPFFSKDKSQMFRRRLERKMEYPIEISQEAKDLIDQLLQGDPKIRLGSKGSQQIKKHQFFKNINFDKLKNKQIDPPYEFDRTQFRYFDQNLIKTNPEQFMERLDPTKTDSTVKNQFSNFTYEQMQQINVTVKQSLKNSQKAINQQLDTT